MIPFEAKTDPEVIKEANEGNEWQKALENDEVGKTSKKEKPILPRWRMNHKQMRAVRRLP